jgi:hypothetical protein
MTRRLSDNMKKLLSILIFTIGLGAALWASGPLPTSPSKSSEQPYDSIHTPAELVQAMRSAFGNNQSRAIHGKSIILEGDFTPDAHAYAKEKRLEKLLTADSV